MGARNVIAAYHRWAGRVPPMSMQVLVYMAVVTRDGDDWPWYGQGQAAIAEFGMGRPNPDDADLRAVRRAMTPLLDAGAVTTERAATHRGDGNSVARYRLNLTDAADTHRNQWEQTPAGQRRAKDPRRAPKPQDGKRPTTDPSHRTESAGAIGRFVASHRTESGEPWDGNRPTKETRGDKRSEKTEEEAVDLTAPVTPAHPPANGQAQVVEIFPGASQEPRYVTRPPWTTRAADTITAATAARAARIAQHQAELAAQQGGTP